MVTYQPKLKRYSRRLRQQQTDAEQKLWMRLRRKQIHNLQFYRQKPLGNYIVDFYCPKAKLIIELDGGQHFIDAGIEKDAERDQYLRVLGMHVCRFSNREIMENFERVLQHIWNELAIINLPSPLFQKEGNYPRSIND